MKTIQHIIIIILLLAVEAFAQPSTPSGYTTNYGLRMYAEGAYPTADSLNANLIAIDAQIKNRDLRVDSLKTAFLVSHNFPAGTLKANTVSTSQIQDNSVTTSKIQVLSIDNSRIANTTISPMKFIYPLYWDGEGFADWIIGTNSDDDVVIRRNSGNAIRISGSFTRFYGDSLLLGSAWMHSNGTGIRTEGLETEVLILHDILGVDENGATFEVDVDVEGEYKSYGNTVIDEQGLFRPGSSSNASAPPNSIFYSTDDSRLKYKDPGGSLHNLY